MNDAISDILKVLGPGAYVELANDAKMSFELNSDHVLTQQQIDAAKSIFQSLGKDRVRCSVNLQSKILFMSRSSSCSMPTKGKLLSSAVKLEAETESERQLMEAAQALGTIDYDELIPTCTYSKEANHTVLSISGLLHISHDLVLEYLSPSHAYVRVQYDMDEGCMQLLVPHAGKRKR